MIYFALFAPIALAAGMAAAESEYRPLRGAPWPMHAIDTGPRGADGTKLADVDGDRLPDIVSGWEEEGETRLYLNPGPAGAKSLWPKATLGLTPDVEDAAFVDLDGDGRLDVVSSTEGGSRRMFVHWGPDDAKRLLDAGQWKQDVFPALSDVTRWMFAEAAQLDGRYGIDLIVGGRIHGNAQSSVLGWLEAPASPRDVAAWKWHPLLDAGWIMSIEIADMDGDGDADILYSDRKGPNRGVFWLENPGAVRIAGGAALRRHRIGPAGLPEYLFLSQGDVDGDGLIDLAVAVECGAVSGEREPNRNSRVLWMRRLDASGDRWEEREFPVPANTGNVKAVAIGDLDRDGRADLAVSCESAIGERRGVYWLRQDGTTAAGDWEPFDISGAPGIKFDLVRLIDLDADGDLDVLTNEELEWKRGLGVVWYENPLH